jgi:outer membrane beta-barrel protein
MATREESMRRTAIRLCIWTATALAVCSTGSPAFGQEQKDQAPAGGEAPAEPPAELPPAQSPPSPATAAEVATARTPTETVRAQGERWNEIVVLPRRTVLKARRVELFPVYHFNFANPLIRHHGIGAQINYFLSEALWLGIEGAYYFPEQDTGPKGTYFLIGAQDKVLPAVNKLIFSALLDFGYVPVQGKFALFNRKIVHWEGYVTAGVGTFMNEVIPVKADDPAFRNISFMFNAGFGSRLFLTRWLTLNAYLKLFGYLDTFEPVGNQAFTRTGTGCQAYPKTEEGYAQCRKDNGSTTLSVDPFFGIGLSFFLPPKFEYRHPR